MVTEAASGGTERARRRRLSGATNAATSTTGTSTTGGGQVGTARSGAQPEPIVLQVPPELWSVRVARRRLAEVGVRWGCPQGVIDDAGVVLSELLSNGVLHAGTELRVVIELGGSGALRIEVHDGSPLPLLPPLPHAATLAAATGRGLAVVAALASSWGWSASSGGGKVVWAEIGPDQRPVVELRESQLRPVQLLAVPVRLLKASEEHFDDLFRELQMASALPARTAAPSGAVSRTVPGPVSRLAERAEQVKKGLSPLREPARRAIQEGSRRSESVVDFELLAGDDMPGVFALCEKLLHAAASAARAGQLLTEPPAPEVEAWRRWLGREVEEQVAGGPPRPCPFPPLPRPEQPNMR